MVSMKMTPAERSEYPETAMASQPVYPYGLRLCLCDDALKKIGITELPKIDEVMEITCKVQVVSVRSQKVSDEYNDDGVDLQITDMEIVSSGGKSAAEKLYGG